LRGIYLDGVVMDEVADMRPNVWGEVIRPTLTDRLGWAVFIGTPKGIDLFYEVYQKALAYPLSGLQEIYRADETGLIN
jgi:phage terminase large subunit